MLRRIFDVFDEAFLEVKSQKYFSRIFNEREQFTDSAEVTKQRDSSVKVEVFVDSSVEVQIRNILRGSFYYTAIIVV